MSFKDEVSHIADVEAHWDFDLSKETTFRLTSRGDLIEVKSELALAKLLPLLKKYQRPWRMLGWGANQVLLPQERDILLRLDFGLSKNLPENMQQEYELSASVSLNQLTSHAIKHSLRGWEVFTGIPASLGGAIFMNAGTALGEIGSIIKSVRLMNDDGKIFEHIVTTDSFSYRHNSFCGPKDVIVSATLVHKGVDPKVADEIKRYLEYRKQSQPLATKNCGCVFKNATRELQAGRLIDLTGLKGLSFHSLKVSHKHSNFIEHTGGANSEDFLTLVGLIRQQTLLHLGVEFELEVKTS